MYSNKIFGDFNYDIHHLPQIWYGVLESAPASFKTNYSLDNYYLTFLQSGNIPLYNVDKSTPVFLQAAVTYDEVLASGYNASNLLRYNPYDIAHPMLDCYIEWIEGFAIPLQSGYYRYIPDAYTDYNDITFINNQYTKYNWANSTLFDIQRRSIFNGQYIGNIILSGIPSISGETSPYPIYPSIEVGEHTYDWYYWEGAIYHTIRLACDNGFTIMHKSSGNTDNLPHGAYFPWFTYAGNAGFGNLGLQSGTYKSYMPGLQLQDIVVSGSKYYYFYDSQPVLLSPPEFYNPNANIFSVRPSGGYQEYDALKFAYDNVRIKAIFKSDRLLKKSCFYANLNGNIKKYITSSDEKFGYTYGYSPSTSESLTSAIPYKPSGPNVGEYFDYYGFPPSGEFNELWVTVALSGEPYTLYYRGRDFDNIIMWGEAFTSTFINAPSYGLSGSYNIIPHVQYNLNQILHDNISTLIEPSSYLYYRPKSRNVLDYTNRPNYIYPSRDSFIGCRLWKGTIENIIEELEELPNGLRLQNSRVAIVVPFNMYYQDENDFIQF